MKREDMIWKTESAPQGAVFTTIHEKTQNVYVPEQTPILADHPDLSPRSSGLSEGWSVVYVLCIHWINPCWEPNPWRKKGAKEGFTVAILTYDCLFSAEELPASRSWPVHTQPAPRRALHACHPAQPGPSADLAWPRRNDSPGSPSWPTQDIPGVNEGPGTTNQSASISSEISAMLIPVLCSSPRVLALSQDQISVWTWHKCL